MGTKIHGESYMPGFHSMGNLNEDSSSGWSMFYGDKTVANGHYYNGYMQRTSVDVYEEHEKDALKQKMLEHEAVFKNQVSELHRLYRIQRDMMDEVKRKEPHKHRASMEPASSSSIKGSKLPSKDAEKKWHMAGFSLSNSGYDRTPVSEVKFVNSPVSCNRGSPTQMGQLSFLNGSASKDSKALDSRPVKLRRKSFDLHLPAEEYIDTEEGYAPDGSRDNGPETSTKFSLDSHAGIKTDRQIDASASVSVSRLRGSIGLADLNDPIQSEEATAPSSVNFFGRASENGVTEQISQPPKSNTGYLGRNGETAHMHNGFLIPSAVKSKVNDMGWLSSVDESGFSRSHISSVTQGHQPVKSCLPSHTTQGILSQIRHPSGTCPTGYIREERGKEVPWDGIDSDRNFVHLNKSWLEPVASWTHGSFQCFGSSSFASSRDNSHPGTVWAKPGSAFAQHATTFEASSNSAVVMNGSLQPSAQIRGPLGGKCQVDTESKLNGFNQASTSGSKGIPIDFPLASLCNVNCFRAGDLASDRSTNHQLGKIQDPSCRADSKLATVINLNEACSQSSLDEVVIHQDLTTTGKRKSEDRMTALPWLESKPTSETQTVKKLLGFPIFDKGIPESESSSVDCRPEGKNSNNERKNGLIDINVACEPDDQIAAEELNIEKEKKKGACVRDSIDLNTCASDSEDPRLPCNDRNCAGVKIALEIDLEAPVFPESEDDDKVSTESSQRDVSVAPLVNKDEQTDDLVLRDAAETVFAISSSCRQIHIDDNVCYTSETFLEESVCWFVDAVSSYANKLEKISGKESRLPQLDYSNKMDDFEATTLQLKEAKEEDYLPQPFVPEVEKEDDTRANMAPNRSRRGLPRRGRQRRDFQRDILPGLATLARHEVTEDIQTFGGLMRALGHPWNSGLTRRNGGTRGRRRAVVETVPTVTPIPVCAPLVQQFTRIEAGLEERSLTGWGKTTRRPRRQRCPAGNPQPAAVLI